ncbi:hypothetical protein FACS1894166_08450 [Bacilli bacterium]|nr:hypothetical protein FACS1894166_08450 [Bacilli bacterium]
MNSISGKTNVSEIMPFTDNATNDKMSSTINLLKANYNYHGSYTTLIVYEQSRQHMSFFTITTSLNSTTHYPYHSINLDNLLTIDPTGTTPNNELQTGNGTDAQSKKVKIALNPYYLYAALNLYNAENFYEKVQSTYASQLNNLSQDERHLLKDMIFKGMIANQSDAAAIIADFNSTGTITTMFGSAAATAYSSMKSNIDYGTVDQLDTTINGDGNMNTDALSSITSLTGQNYANIQKTFTTQN